MSEKETKDAPMEEEDDGVDYEEEVEEEEDGELPDVVDLENLETQGMQVVDFGDNEEEPVDSDDETVDQDEEEGEIEMFDPERNDAVRTLQGHTSPVHSLALHPKNPSLLVSGGEDDTAIVWNWHDGTLLKKLQGHTDTVIAVAFSFDGALVITGGMEGAVRLWNSETFELVHTLTELAHNEGDSVEWLVAHPKGPILFAGGSGGGSAMWNMKGECMQQFWGHGDKVTCGCLSGDGRLLVTGSADASIKIFSPQSGEVTQTIEKGSAAGVPQEEVTCLAASEENSELMIAGYVDGTMVWFNPKNGKIFAAIKEHTGSVECISMCTAQPLVASSDSTGCLCVWDTTAQAKRYVINTAAPVPKVLWQGEKLFYCTVLGSIVMRDGRTQDEETATTWLGHRAAVQNIVVASEPPCVISCADDNDLQVYKIA